MMRPTALLLTIALLASCATTIERTDPPPVACDRVDDSACIERHRAALEVCGQYHQQATRRAERRAREAELYQWIATGSTATSVVLGATLIGFAATPADL